MEADLDFDSDGDGDVDANDHNGAYWNSGAGWSPIGNDTSASTRYQARFKGNGHTIANLFFNRSSSNDLGLFGATHDGSMVELVGLTNVNVSGENWVGALVGTSRGDIYGSYSTGRVSGENDVGGLAGLVTGSIKASYSTAAVIGTGSGSSNNAGGLAGWSGFASGGSITASYATGSVTAAGTLQIGGLVGEINGASAVATASYAIGRVSGPGNRGGLIGSIGSDGGSASDSYYDRRRSGQSDTGKGDPQSTALLQGTDGYTGIFANWNVDVTGTSDADDPWDFGGPREYPRLKIDFNDDGVATWEEFGQQHRYIPPSPPPYNPAHDHPEIYQNPRHQMATSCDVQTTGTGDDAVSTSTITFNLGRYTRPITLALSLWDGDVFRSLQSQNIAMPELRREGQTATVEVATDPAQTRFRLDSEYGLNLVLGYADCHTDDPEE